MSSKLCLGGLLAILTLMFRRLTEIILVIKWPLILALLLITCVTGASISHLSIDPTVESLFIKHSPAYQYYREFREKYGSDQLVVVAMATSDVFTYDHFYTLKSLTEEVQGLDMVERAISLSNALDIRHKFMGVKVEAAAKGVLEGERTLKNFREDVLSNELFLNNLVSPDGNVASILIYLKPETKGNRGATDFVRSLRASLDRETRHGVDFYLAGAPVEQYDFVDLIRKDQFTFVPMIGLLLFAATFLIYRSWACTFVAMSILFMTLVWTLGTIALLGQPLNLVTSLLAPVIMIIAVVNAIHLMNLFFEIRPHHSSVRKTVVLTMEQLGVPCFLSHFTTIIGFCSLIFNSIPAIRSFGIFAALGTLYSYLVETLLTPVLLPMLPYRPVKSSEEEGRFFNRVIVVFLERLEFRWKWLIMGLAVSVLAVSLFGISLLEVDTNIVKQMNPKSKLAESTRFIDDNLTGVYTLAFVFSRKDGEPLTDLDTLVRLDQFKDYMESMPEITKVNSILSVLKKIHSAREDSKAAYTLAEDQGDLDRYFRGLSDSEDPEVWKLVSRDFRSVTLHAQMKAVGTKEGALVEERARQYIAEFLARDFQVTLTGNVVLLGHMAKNIVISQMRSFGFAFAAILFLIALIFRSISMGLLAAIPNLLPICAIYGLMGLLGIELSTSTAMISSIVLGLVVDASIHFLHRFRMEFNIRYHYLQALHHTFRNVGQAMVVSTLILMIGFASSGLAQFRPTIHFGILTSVTIFFALICTLLLLPVFLISTKPFGPHRLFQKPKV